MFDHFDGTPTARNSAVVFPLQPDNIHRVALMAKFVQRRSLRRLWIGQSLSLETHQIFAALAGMGLRIPCASGVTLTPLRHPYQAAVEARSVAALTGVPYVAGVGLGSPEFQSTVMENPYPRPRSAAVDFAGTMRELLDGQLVSRRNDYHSVHARLPPLHTPPVEVGLGVLRPRMARAAGAVADVAVTWMTPPNYVRDTLVPELAAGAVEAKRKMPRVATVIHVAVSRQGRNIRNVAHKGAGTHLGANHYTDMLRRAGLAVDPSDSKAGADALLASGVFVTGSPEEIVGALRHYRDCGVDEVILNPAGVMLTEGVHAAVDDLEEIIEAEVAAGV